jgi:hypothetical protein
VNPTVFFKMLTLSADSFPSVLSCDLQVCGKDHLVPHLILAVLSRVMSHIRGGWHGEFI